MIVKNKHPLLGFLFAMGLIFSAQHAVASCSKPLHIAYSDWSRIGPKSSDTDNEFGMDFELLKAILKTANCPFDHRPIPFKRIQEAIKHGLVDGTIGASLTIPRQEYAWFTDPYRKEIMAMFMLTDERDKFRPKNMTDLAISAYRFGLGIGSWHGAKFETLVENRPEFRTRILHTDDFNIIFQWLMHGRVDIAIIDTHYGQYLLKQSGLSGKIQPHPFHINANDVHIMLSKKSVPIEDAVIISKAVAQFRGTEEYMAILKKYSAVASTNQ